MSKLLTPFLLPPAFIALVWGLGLILAMRSRKRIAWTLIISSFAMYYLLSTWPVAGALIGSLESGYPPRPAPDAPSGAEALVVLSGGVSVSGGSPAGVELGSATWRRLWRGAEVFHRTGKGLPFIYSGNEGLPAGGGAAVDPPALAAARRLGIPEEMFWSEDRSGDTFESAVEVKELLDRKLPGSPRHRVLLVTSAWHMPRARRAFESQGMEVLPEPSDYRSGPASLGIAALVPSYEALLTSSVAIREWIGLLAYRLFKGC